MLSRDTTRTCGTTFGWLGVISSNLLHEFSVGSQETDESVLSVNVSIRWMTLVMLAGHR